MTCSDTRPGLLKLGANPHNSGALPPRPPLRRLVAANAPACRPKTHRPARASPTCGRLRDVGERSAPEGRATLAFPRMRKDPRSRERGGGPKPGQHLRTCIVFIELDRATLAEACVGVAERRADRPLARGLLKRVVSRFQRTAQELGAPECALRDELATRGPSVPGRSSLSATWGQADATRERQVNRESIQGVREKVAHALPDGITSAIA